MNLIEKDYTLNTKNKAPIFSDINLPLCDDTLRFIRNKTKVGDLGIVRSGLNTLYPTKLNLTIKSTPVEASIKVWGAMEVIIPALSDMLWEQYPQYLKQFYPKKCCIFEDGWEAKDAI